MTRTMAKQPKKADDEGQPPRKQARSGSPLHAWINEELMAALDAHLEGTDPRISKTAFIETALKKLLREYGAWPPKASEGGE